MKLTATYTMINNMTDKEQVYYAVKNMKFTRQDFPENFIKDTAKKQVNNFPAFKSGIMRLKDNKIYVTDYKGRLITVLQIII